MNREPFRDDPIFAMRSALRGPDVPHDCFKDEIAIDFPSIGSLVDRVRASFLGDEAVEACGTLRRELRLSGREARWGAVVPLDRKSTRLNSSHVALSRMPSSA